MAALTVGGLIAANSSFAEDWKADHPRRVEVNQRQRHEERRIGKGIKHGQIDAGEAAQLQAEQQKIHNEQMQDAAMHNGHITKKEKRQLNREENAESRQIFHDRHN